MNNKPFFYGSVLASCVVLVVIVSSQTIQKYFPATDPNSYKEIDKFQYDSLMKNLESHPTIKGNVQKYYEDGIISVREWIDLSNQVKEIDKPETDAKLLEQKKQLIEKVYN